ncbi:putative quinol monooxygenase [Enterovibrio coralii]|uniref:ABM domain-containing protein n=1 Tax=Enterovibrio coralii TaxID=294935 RepID=A0A135IBU4_9GAMM|nr:putative quinol monooxygenase [Enterovibrio coralii]KXF82941.1 hypothetical protein ATN88_04055 [Enterovibrio coralii]
MYVVTVMFKVSNGYFNVFSNLVLQNAALSLEEPGCLQFDVCFDEPNQTVFLYEKYTSRLAFEQHLVTAHFFSFDQACIGKLDEKTVQCFERVWPRVGE